MAAASWLQGVLLKNYSHVLQKVPWRSINKKSSTAGHLGYIFRLKISTNKINPDTNRMFTKNSAAFSFQNRNVLVVVILCLIHSYSLLFYIRIQVIFICYCILFYFFFILSKFTISGRIMILSQKFKDGQCCRLPFWILNTTWLSYSIKICTSSHKDHWRKILLR